jgi:hypothetical protein
MRTRHTTTERDASPAWLTDVVDVLLVAAVLATMALAGLL